MVMMIVMEMVMIMMVMVGEDDDDGGGDKDDHGSDGGGGNDDSSSLHEPDTLTDITHLILTMTLCGALFSLMLQMRIGRLREEECFAPGDTARTSGAGAKVSLRSWNP